MINKLTLNGITIEYPSHMTVAISGETIRLVPDEAAAAPAVTQQPVPAPPRPPVSPAPAMAKPSPAAHATVNRVIPKYPPVKLAPSSMVTKPTRQSRSALPSDWKEIVLTTLRQNNGSAYARRLSLRVFAGVTKLSYSQATQLRRALRGMVESGELVTLGSGEGHVAQALYGLPGSQPNRLQAAPEG